jgi:glycosyltransferase involved in cell wall biosynthesis
MEVDRPIKVLYFTHPAAFNIFGGAEIQMMKTKRYLEKSGKCFIKLFDIFCDKLEDYDALHIFQMSPECLSLFRLAKLKGLKTVLTPIWWEPYSRGLQKFGPMAFARFYSNLKIYKMITFRELYPFKDFLDLADVILPSSEMESMILSHRFRVNPGKFFVVYNGVDDRFAKAEPNLFVEKYGIKDFILYVGKVGKVKNLLSLLKVCREIEIPTVIIGDAQPFEKDYFMACKKIAEFSRNIHFIGSLPHDSDELASAYAAAKVFVLPSWHEVASLSALEAGLAGCNMVITQRSSAPEYFKNFALYVNPASVKDIKEKILEAYAKPRTDELKQHILNNYTWEIVAKRTMEAYKLALKR